MADQNDESRASHQPTRRERLERNLGEVLSGFEAIMAFAVGMILAPAAALLTAAGLSGRDPFRLERYGKTLLTGSVEKDLGIYTVLLGCVMSFELFAWGMLWHYTGVSWLFKVLMPLAFTALIVMLDRGILIMDGFGKGKSTKTVIGRVSMLVVLACITSIPVELGVFAPEIDAKLHERETAKLDVVREKARAYEQGLETTRSDASDAALAGNPESVVSGRAAGRAEIVGRLQALEDKLAREIGEGSLSGRGAGLGPAAAGLRVQVGDVRSELTAYDQATDSMRTGAVQAGADERGRHAAALDEKLQRIETMSPDQLVQAYGGEYREPNGFMARYRTMEEIAATPDGSNGFFTYSQLVIWGCRAIMTVFGLGVLFMKFVMANQETTAYFSAECQAMAGNRDVIAALRSRAQSGDDEAIAILGRVARTDPEIAAFLVQIVDREEVADVAEADMSPADDAPKASSILTLVAPAAGHTDRPPAT